jgi:hypothetical protein
MALKGEVRKSAEYLLLLMPRDYRLLAAGTLRWHPRNRNPFAKRAGHPTRFGVAAVPFNHAGMLPLPLQPLFSTGLTRGCPPKLVLDTLAFGGEREAAWASKCLDWNDPEAIRVAFEDVDPATLAEFFLRTSSSPQATARRLAVDLVASVGLRMLQTIYRDRIMHRLITLGQDGNVEVRGAVIRAAQSLGLTDQVPVVPIPTHKLGESPESGKDDEDFDCDLEELLNQLGP